MLKSYRVGEVGLVAHKILETAQSPNFSFHFLFDFGLGTRACQKCFNWMRFTILYANEAGISRHPFTSAQYTVDCFLNKICKMIF